MRRGLLSNECDTGGVAVEQPGRVAVVGGGSLGSSHYMHFRGFGDVGWIRPVAHTALISARIIINLCMLDTSHPSPLLSPPHHHHHHRPPPLSRSLIISKSERLHESLLCCYNLWRGYLFLEPKRRIRKLNLEVIWAKVRDGRATVGLILKVS